MSPKAGGRAQRRLFVVVDDDSVHDAHFALGIVRIDELDEGQGQRRGQGRGAARGPHPGPSRRGPL